MSTGIPALTYLPQIEIAVASGSTFAIETLKAGLNKVAQMQEEETPDATYLAEKCLMDNPYSTCTWDIVVQIGNAAGDYLLTFDSEDITTITTIGRPALTTRRLLDISILASTAFEFTVRSAQAALNLVDQFEDAVAQTGVGTTGDGVFTNLIAKGPTPFQEFLWDINKADGVYILTPTASS